MSTDLRVWTDFREGKVLGSEGVHLTPLELPRPPSFSLVAVECREAFLHPQGVLPHPPSWVPGREWKVTDGLTMESSSIDEQFESYVSGRWAGRSWESVI
jgi:hypothetical protein